MKIFQQHIFKKGTRPELVEGPILSRVEGMSLIEIVIALAIFSLISSAIASLALSGMNGLVESADMAKAESYAQEGVEAVKSVRDNAWNTITSTTVVVTSTGNVWSLQNGVSETIDKFTRTITLSDVCRDIVTNAATTTCSGAGVYTDVQSKKVAVTVTWPVRQEDTNSPIQTVQKVLYVTNWNSHDWIQTDWSGGTGQSIWSDITKYNLGTNVYHSNIGGLQLAYAPGGSWINAGGTLVEHTDNVDFDAGTYTNTVRTGTGVDASIVLDQGPQWSAHADSGASGQDMYGIVMSSSTNGWAVGGSNKILRYNGTNWTQEYDPGGNNVNAISYVDTSNVFSAGASGKIWKYNGSSWSENKDTGNETWNAIDMFSSTVGWTGGNSGTIARYSGGTTWTETTVPSSANIYGMDAIAANNVWASGANGRFWRYNGSSWSLNADTGAENWRAIAAVSATSIWAVGDGGAIGYYNGSGWNDAIASPTSENLYDIQIIASNDIWAAGTNGVILHYDGSSWTVQSTTGSETWRGIGMTGSSSGFVVGLGGDIFEYKMVYDASGTFTSSVIDGGVGSNVWESVSWTETLPAGSDITIATRSGNTATPDGSWSGWSGGLTDPAGSAVGSGNSRYLQYQISFTRATDPLQTPQFDDITILLNTPTSEDLYGIDAVSASNIWAVGTNGEIIQYNGTDWNTITSPTGNDLYGIDMISSSDGWAVGLSGKILHYDGSSWSQFSDTGAESWYAVSMASSTVGFAVGGSSNNMVEYNGSAWTEFAGPVSQAINDIHMFSDGTGWAVGDSGKILYYDGSNWTEDSDQGTQNIEGLSMTSVSDGWAVGSSGKIWHYNGSSWSEYLDTGGDNWESVSMANTNKGWIFGDANNAMVWDGTSWTSQAIPTTQTLYDVKAIAQTNAWAVGRNGSIIHFDQSALYEIAGTATSSAFDTANAASSVEAISWHGDLATSTCASACSIRFQVRGAATSGALSSAAWIGPDGTSGTYFATSTGSLIPASLNNNRWMQYKADLFGDAANTPILQDVKINYK